MQQSHIPACSFCATTFSLDRHLPHVLPRCGHNICASCLQTLFLNASTFECPADKTRYDFSTLSIEAFQVNLAIKERITGSHNANLCAAHQQELKLKCLSDGARICSECALFGDHKKHNVKKIEEVVKEAKEKIDILEKSLENITLYYDRVSSVINENEAKIIEDINSNCERFASGPRRRDVIKMQMQRMIDKERKALEETLGPASSIKLIAVMKISVLNEEVIERVSDKVVEEDLDISNYMSVVSKPKFEFSLKEITRRIGANSLRFYTDTELYRNAGYHLSNLDKSIVEEELSYITGRQQPRRSRMLTLKVILVNVVIFYFLYYLIASGLVKPFGLDLRSNYYKNPKNNNANNDNRHHRNHRYNSDDDDSDNDNRRNVPDPDQWEDHFSGALYYSHWYPWNWRWHYDWDWRWGRFNLW